MNRTVTTYVLHGKNVVHLSQGGSHLHFFYGADGSPAMEYKGVVTNLQGNVIGIVNTSGTYVVQYAYDAFGKLIQQDRHLGNYIGYAKPV